MPRWPPRRARAVHPGCRPGRSTSANRDCACWCSPAIYLHEARRAPATISLSRALSAGIGPRCGRSRWPCARSPEEAAASLASISISSFSDGSLLAATPSSSLLHASCRLPVRCFNHPAQMQQPGAGSRRRPAAAPARSRRGRGRACPAVPRGVRGGGDPPRAAGLIGAQLGRPQERGRRRCVPGAQLGAAGGGLQRRRDLLVAGQRGHRLVPDPAVGVLLAGQGARQRRVHPLPLAQRRRLIERRADQRMPEGDRGAGDPDQGRTPPRDRARRREAAARPPRAARPARPRCCPRRRSAARSAPLAGSRPIRCRNTPSSRGVSGIASGSGTKPASCSSTSRAGQLQQRQRVPGGFGEQPVTHSGRRLARPAARTAAADRRSSPVSVSSGKSGGLEPARLALARPEQDRQPLGPAAGGP